MGQLNGSRNIRIQRKTNMLTINGHRKSRFGKVLTSKFNILLLYSQLYQSYNNTTELWKI